ncbi:MAG: SpoIID/LytB domain-containing protein [Gemmatimonadales bacterium]
MRLRALAPWLLLLAACRPEPVPVPPSPRTAEPEIRVGLVVGAGTLRVGGGAGLAALAADSSIVGVIRAGEEHTVRTAGGLVQVDGLVPAESLTLASTDPDGFVRVNGRDYRGRVVLFRGASGLVAVNRVGLESYLAGVVSAEMGRREPGDSEALKAQAVISRTYALRNRGRWDAQGFDFYATVVDQVYGGVAAETGEGWESVSATAGLVVGYDGAPIDAFFFSTCGGRTAVGTEVFANADRPYLRSIDDVDSRGEAYCRISPRFDWQVEWSGEALHDVLETTLPAGSDPGVSRGSVIEAVKIAQRTRSGRVARLAFQIDGRQIGVSGPAIRQVLRPNRNEILRSAAFELSQTRTGGRVVRLVADGHGAGHGVGFCQWGAVGRARAGQDYREILTAYFPGTDLERYY